MTDRPLSGAFRYNAPTANRGYRYTITAEIARGGMGVVYRAHDAELGRDVALKLAKPDAWQAGERLEREALIGASLNHPNILSVIDAGTSDEGAWVATPWIDGESLAQLLDQPDRALRALSQAARGLAYAHQRGVVHRDVKPSNVLVQHDVALMIDWGLGRQLTPLPDAEPLTETGVVLGTPGYCAPEQRMGSAPAVVADVWSLGAILWEILGQTPPYAPHSQPSLEQQVIAHSYQRLPGPLGALANDCLSLDVTQRPADAGVFADRLCALLQPDPVPQPSRSWVFAGLFAGLLLGGVAVAVGISATTEDPAQAPWQAVNELAWRDLQAGRTLNVGASLDSLGQRQEPGWSWMPEGPVIQATVLPFSCEEAYLANGQVSCQTGSRFQLIDLATEQVTATYESEGIVQPGRYSATVRDKSLVGRLYPDGARSVHDLVGERELLTPRVFDGPESLLFQRSGQTKMSPLSPDVVRASPDDVVHVPLIFGASAWRDGRWLMYSHGDEPFWIGLDGDFSAVETPVESGAVIHLEATETGYIAVWDRAGVVHLDANGSPVYRWRYPDNVKVDGVAIGENRLAIATQQHGVLLFDLWGGLIGQISHENVDDLTMEGDDLIVLNGTLTRYQVTSSGPIAWFGDVPITALHAREGRLAIGDSTGVLTEPMQHRQSDLGPNVIRDVWYLNAESVMANAIDVGVVTLTDQGRHETTLGLRDMVPLGDAFVGLSWLTGLVLPDNEPERSKWINDTYAYFTIEPGAAPNTFITVRQDDMVLSGSTPDQALKPLFKRDDWRIVSASAEGILGASRHQISMVGSNAETRWQVASKAAITAVVNTGDTCASGDRSGQIVLYDCATGARLGALSAHKEAIAALVSFDGALYSASHDGSVRRWTPPVP